MSREQNRRDKKSEKIRLDLQKDVDELDPTAIITTKRTRKPAQHRDQAFVDASLKQMNDAGKKGGLVAGSMYHYDRGYCNHGKNGRNYGGFWSTEKDEEKECSRHYY